jgi:RND family efflux transporter MFP subunit
MKTYSRVAFIFLILMITACSGSDDPERPETPEDVDIRPDVIFAQADDSPLHIYVESQGIVEPIRDVTIRPRISGFITQTVLEDGSRINEGDVMISFDKQEWEYELSQAENDYQSALAEYTIEKQQRETSGRSNSASDRLLKISTGLAEAELAVERAELNLSYTTMIAPFSGELSVPERLSMGAYIPSGTELGRLLDDSTVLIRFDVLESEINRLEEGMQVELRTPSGAVKTGRIRALSPVIDSESKTGQVITEVENGDRALRPGMTVEGRIRVETYEGKARVPRSAILERDGGRTLLFKLNDETVEWVYVEPEYSTSNWAIINHEDVAPGDTIAIDRHFALSHLQQVRARMAGQILQEGVEEIDE